MRPDILTIAKRYFDFLEPERSQFGIAEIAHALSNLCRYNGHVSTFSSAAKHTVAKLMVLRGLSMAQNTQPTGGEA